MSKTGYEYATSLEKRGLDLAVAYPLLPAYFCLKAVVGSLLGRHSLVEPLYMQKRTGINYQPFLIYKFTTIDPVTDEPVSQLASKIRTLGLDELAQVKNLFEGTMAAVGHRPIIPEEYEEVRD